MCSPNTCGRAKRAQRIAFPKTDCFGTKCRVARSRDRRFVRFVFRISFFEGRADSVDACLAVFDLPH